VSKTRKVVLVLLGMSLLAIISATLAALGKNTLTLQQQIIVSVSLFFSAVFLYLIDLWR